ncbi:MAG TPA: TatD family hydrolase [Chlamydiales bacterium]|nr:TatD family hydrolase [Chlamydiales bacterium]
MFFDSHAHLTSFDVIPHLEGILFRAKNVKHILNICTDKTSLEQGIALSKKNPHIFNAGATTPHDVDTEGELFFPIFEKAAKEKKLVAIGETGLDYYNSNAPISLQKKYLSKYLFLASETQLPVIFHCREAFNDLFSIVDQEYNGPAILHCFTGSIQEAEEVLKRGWFLSLSGIVTFKKSEALREVAKMIPLNQLLIETDTPYLAPQSQRGKMNEPSFIAETAQCIADVKGISLEDVARSTFENASSLFMKRSAKLQSKV